MLLKHGVTCIDDFLISGSLMPERFGCCVMELWPWFFELQLNVFTREEIITFDLRNWNNFFWLVMVLAVLLLFAMMETIKITA